MKPWSVNTSLEWDALECLRVFFQQTKSSRRARFYLWDILFCSLSFVLQCEYSFQEMPASMNFFFFFCTLLLAWLSAKPEGSICKWRPTYLWDRFVLGIKSDEITQAWQSRLFSFFNGLSFIPKWTSGQLRLGISFEGLGSPPRRGGI
jgi:hypothetical protein